MDKQGRQITIFIWFLVLLIIVGCDSENAAIKAQKREHCAKELGCLNQDFIDFVNSHCPKNKAQCSLSFDEVFSGIDKVYFVERLSARLDQCTTIAISENIKKSYTPLCQYVLFEQNGTISSYLRGYCTSEIKVTKNELGFDSSYIELVSLMEAKRSISVKTSSEKDMQGKVKKLYYIIPPKGGLVKFDTQKDTCVGSP